MTRVMRPMMYSWLACVGLVGLGALGMQWALPTDLSQLQPWVVTGGEYTTVNRVVTAWPPADVVVVGNSRAREAVNAAVLGLLLRVPKNAIRNYAVSAANAQMEYALVRLMHDMHKLPRVILFPVSPRDIAGGGRSAASFLPLSDGQSATKLISIKSLAGWAGAIAGRHVRLLWLGARLSRSVPRSVPALGDMTTNQRSHRGYVKRNEERSAAENPPNVFEIADYMRDTELAGAGQLDPDAKLWAQRAIHLARESGCSVIVAELPLSSRFRASYPPGVYEDFVSFFQRTCDAEAVPFVRLQDLGDPFNDLDIADAAHMNWTGAQKFTFAILPFVASALQQGLKANLPETSSFAQDGALHPR